MSRLTQRNTDGSVGIAEFRCYNYQDFQKMASKLADYEDLEEQGRLLVLPVAIGDTVWKWEYPTRADENGSEWTILNINKAMIVPVKFNLSQLAYIGELYFTTQAEAEAALRKEQQKA